MKKLEGIKIALVSLGCDKNLMDSEVMLGLVNEDGAELTQKREEADVIIVNTCCFILDASQESVDSIIDAGIYKSKGRCKSVIVTGCLAQRYKEDIFDEIPGVDAVVGVSGFENISDIVRKSLDDKDTALCYCDESNNLPDEDKLLKRIVSTPKHYAYIKIAEGCDNCCSYCTIPSIRGGYRSRKIESLKKEAESLAQGGVREIILVAQDTSVYGKDIYGEKSLHRLLREFSEVKGIEWIRILYCYPEHIYDELIDEMAANKKVLHYIDMPIQHSTNKILRLMRRESSKEKLVELIAKLRGKIPDIVIRTTLITGFPGEKQSDFLEMLKFVKETKFDRLGVFQYSPEEGTPAATLPNPVDKSTKQKRYDKLMSLQKEISKEKLKLRVGKEFIVVTDGKLKEKNMYYGRIYSDSPNIDGLAFFKDETGVTSSGDFVRISINESSDYDLMGVVCNEAESR